MHTSTCCGNKRISTRCRVPLIEICDTINKIKLDLSTCNVCAITPAALLIEKAGCPEYEIVCVPTKPISCCGAEIRMPEDYYNKRKVELPKPSVTYTLHEVDADGMSVFVVDAKLKKLGYGRLTATVLLDSNSSTTSSNPKYRRTELVFDIDYVEYKARLNSIVVNTDSDLGENF